MTVSNKNLRVMENLLHHDDIRALIWVERDGSVKARRGQAISLKLDADDPTLNMPIDDASDDNATPESLYICQFKDDDFLIVIFDDDADFDDLKVDVDATLKKGEN